MADPKTLAPAGVTLKWGIGYTLAGYILKSSDEEHNCDVTKTLDEKGSIIDVTFYNFTKSLKVGGLIKDATVLPAPGDVMTVNGVAYYVMPPVSVSRADTEKAKFTISLERAEDNAIPAAA